jgi:hypothetical protein
MTLQEKQSELLQVGKAGRLRHGLEKYITYLACHYG